MLLEIIQKGGKFCEGCETVVPVTNKKGNLLSQNNV